MKEVIERCNWLVNKCEDKAITPDVKDDISYLLEEIERLNNIINKALEYINSNEMLKLREEIEYCNDKDLFDDFTGYLDRILRGSDSK